MGMLMAEETRRTSSSMRRISLILVFVGKTFLGAKRRESGLEEREASASAGKRVACCEVISTDWEADSEGTIIAGRFAERNHSCGCADLSRARANSWIVLKRCCGSLESALSTTHSVSGSGGNGNAF